MALGLERQGKDFIPNDLSLGENGKCCMILTGPNMGTLGDWICFARATRLVSTLSVLDPLCFFVKVALRAMSYALDEYESS